MCIRDRTGGVKPEKLDSEFFDFTTGLYPSLKSFANEARGKMLRSDHVGFKNGEVRNNMRNDVDLSTYDNLSWSLDGQTSSSSYFSIDNNRLKVTIPTDMNMGSATLNAKIGDNIVKSFDLKAIPVFLSGEGSSDSPYLINNTCLLYTSSSQRFVIIWIYRKSEIADRVLDLLPLIE